MLPIKKCGNAYLLSLSHKFYPAEAVEKTIKDYPKYVTKVINTKNADHIICKIASSSLIDALEIGNYLLSLSR